VSSFERACALAELAEGRPHAVTIEDYDIVLIRVGDQVHALADNCSHQDFPLSHGEVSSDRIRCAAHGAEFCLKSGKPLKPPAFAPVRTFDVRIEAGEVWVAVE
jgi:3-phenylpropionate/trans-cinnamate dioxygenase ferredoxin subunit